jgi:hypothetical protein
LPGQQYLVAHGEAGVTLYRADGSVRFHYNLSASDLVVSDQATRAIAVLKRGALLSFSRLNLQTGQVKFWSEGHFHHFAKSYDGDVWLVAQTRQVFALDVRADTAKAIWSVSDLPGPVVQLRRQVNSLVLLLSNNHAMEYWRYVLPSMTLKAREPVEVEVVAAYDFVDFDQDGAMVYAEVDEANQQLTIGRTLRHKVGILECPLDNWSVQFITAFQDWVVVQLQQVEQTQLWLIDQNASQLGGVRMKVVIQSKFPIRSAIDQSVWLITSEEGGVVTIDLRQGKVVNQLSL